MITNNSKLKQFILKNKEIANNNVRCGCCGNVLQHCGKYQITESENGFESLICETCVSNLRVPKKATRVDPNTGIVQNFVIPPVEEKAINKNGNEGVREQFKRINRPELTEEQLKAKQLAKQQQIQQNNQNVEEKKEKVNQ